MNVQCFKSYVKIKANYSKMLINILISFIMTGPFEVITMHFYYLLTTQQEFVRVITLIIGHTI